MENSIFKNKNFYKGNLHTHTTLSDGKRTPEESIALYREKGYDFLSITDHNIYMPAKQYDDFVLLSGIECNMINYEGYRTCHITGVGGSHIDPTNSNLDMDVNIKKLRDTGAFITVAHPAWSLMHYSDLFKLSDYDAIEIYNDVCNSYLRRGYSDLYIDIIAYRGRTTLITSVDDTHSYETDGFKGYIMVNADNLNNDDIMTNIKSGNFYAGTGFDIEDIKVVDNRLEITFFEDAMRVNFYNNSSHAGHKEIYGPTKKVIYEFGENEDYVRFCAENKDGDKAFSNFIFKNK